MTIQLVKPNKKYLPSVCEAIAEYKAAPSRFEIHAVSKMIAALDDNFANYFIQTENDANGVNLKPNRVAHSIFWLIDDDKYIGTFDLRHTLTPNLEKIGGHIAYQIRPTELRKGYVYAGLKLCLKEAKKRGIEKALLTCRADNAASYGVLHKAMKEYGGLEDVPIEKNGIIEKRIWVNRI